MYAWVWDHLSVAWLTYRGHPNLKKTDAAPFQSSVVSCSSAGGWERCAHLPTVPECGLACSCAGLGRVVSASVSSECGGPGMCRSHRFAPVFLNPWLLHSFHSLLYDAPKPHGIDVPFMTENPTSVNCTSLLTEGSFFSFKDLLLLLFMFIYVEGDVHMPWHVCGGQRTTFGSGFLLPPYNSSWGSSSRHLSH